MNRPGFLAIAVFAMGCSGEIISQNLEGLDPKQQVALDAWVSKALPVLGVKCTPCHDGSMPNIGYIAGDDDLAKRDTLINYMPRVVNLGAPQASRVLTRGAHTGPALEAKEASDVLAWINAEAAARPDVAPIRTAQMALQLCTPPMPCTPNQIDLTPLGVAGSRFEISIEGLADAAYATSMKFVAGADGLYLEHPLLESWPAGATEPKVDPTDRFFAFQVNLAAAAEAPLGTGETLQTWNAADPVSIRFDAIEKRRMTP